MNSTLSTNWCYDRMGVRSGAIGLAGALPSKLWLTGSAVLVGSRLRESSGVFRHVQTGSLAAICAYVMMRGFEDVAFGDVLIVLAIIVTMGTTAMQVTGWPGEGGR